MKEIVFDQVYKTYNPGLLKKKVRAVQGLSLEVGRGEVFGLIGPNGAGKSTSIRLLLGLTRPDGGRVRFRGKELSDADLPRHIGYLPENPYLYDHLTLRELLRFCGRTSGLGAQRLAERSKTVLEQVDMTSVQGRPLRTFSKGMLQRAGIAFALLHDPEVVILDEPMSGLDPIGRQMVFDLVADLKAQGKTIFFCSHILSDVERLCDRIGMMVGGRLVKVFTREEYWQTAGPSIHLQLGAVSAERQQELEKLPVQLRQEAQGAILSLSPTDLPMVSEKLASLGIEVIASRSESLSLETLFMQVVKEATS